MKTKLVSGIESQVATGLGLELIQKIRSGSILVASTISLLMLSPTIAVADDADGRIQDAIAAVGDVAPDVGVSHEIELGANNGLLAQTDLGTATLAENGTTSVLLTSPLLDENDAELSIQLDASSDGDTVVSNENQVVLPSPDEAVTTVIEAVGAGARIQTVLEDNTAPNRFSYVVGDSVIPSLAADGSVDLYLPTAEGAELLVGKIDIPWAFDANNVALETYFEVDGQLVTQVIKTDGAAFPVVADPYAQLINPFQARLRWNRAETATIASGQTAALTVATCTAVGAAFGPVGAAALGGSCGLYAAVLVYNAGVAQNSKPKRCLQLTVTNVFVGAGGWVDTYAC